MDLVHKKLFTLEGGNHTITMAAGVAIIKDQRLLLVRDSDEGFFSFPGGACRADESPIETAIREADEELSIDVKVDPNPYIFKFERYKDDITETVLLFQFRATFVKGIPAITNEIVELKFKPINEDFSDCYPNVTPTFEYFLQTK